MNLNLTKLDPLLEAEIAGYRERRACGYRMLIVPAIECDIHNPFADGPRDLRDAWRAGWWMADEDQIVKWYK